MPEQSSVPIVTVRGEAHLEGPPDLAQFTVTAHRAGETHDSVRSALAAASTQIRDLLSGFASAIEKSSTSGMHVAPLFGRRAQTKVQGYRGSFSTEVVLSDLDALSAVVFALAPVADSQLDGPFWSLRRDNSLYREVRLAAIAEARQRATDYAAAFGSTILDLVEISDLEGGWAGARPMAARSSMMAKGDSDQPDFEFEPPVQTVSGQVTVRFTMSRPDLGTS